MKKLNKINMKKLNKIKMIKESIIIAIIAISFNLDNGINFKKFERIIYRI
jgi:hypothetical protein